MCVCIALHASTHLSLFVSIYISVCMYVYVLKIQVNIDTSDSNLVPEGLFQPSSFPYL